MLPIRLLLGALCCGLAAFAVPRLAAQSEFGTPTAAPEIPQAVPVEAPPEKKFDAATFARPAEGPVPFRRDRLPVEPAMMKEISAQLEQIAHGIPLDQPGQRRGRAQILALALALNPISTVAAQHLDALSRGEIPPATADAGLEKLRETIWQTISWIRSAGGTDADALALCLTDALVISDPDSLRYSAARSRESSAWSGWIPPLAAYQPAPPQQVPDAPLPSDQAAETPPPIILNSATISVPLWRRTVQNRGVVWQVEITTLEMKASQNPADRFQLSIGSGDIARRFSQLSAQLTGMLATIHEKLPTGRSIAISSPLLVNSDDDARAQPIDAAALVLANSAITGIKPTGTVIGRIAEKGKLALPPNPWPQLRAIEAKGGGRLVMPQESADLLSSFLALENPGFFLKNEVLLATDAASLLVLSSSQPPQQIAAVLGEFKEIVAHSTRENIRAYIANRFVRQRLEAIVNQAPWHFSARMLLAQASGKRPATIHRQALATELLATLAPLRWINRDEWYPDRKTQQKLDTSEDTSQELIEKLERYADRNDHDLLESVRNVLSEVRSLAKEIRGIDEEFDGYEDFRDARNRLEQIFQSTITALEQAAGNSKAP
ncbi:MAG: hypothetical protein V4733_03025 [Verrucomicrobiota bacterium]